MKGWMTTVVAVLAAVSTTDAALTPDEKKLYHDIGSGRGLYTPFDMVSVLNVTNFNLTLYDTNKPKTWIIEFYNSWCGHCHRFAPVWKSLASDLFGWIDTIEVGAVDCSSNYNTPLCRDFEIQYYPTIKYFPYRSQPGFLGSQVPQGTVEQLKKSILSKYQEDFDNDVVNKPDLMRFRGFHLRELWNEVHNSVHYIVLILEERGSYLGTELAFDLLPISSVMTKLSWADNTELMRKLKSPELPAVFVCEQNNVAREIIPNTRNRTSYYSALRDVLHNRGIVMPKLEIRTAEDYAASADVSTIMEMMQVNNKIKEKLNQHWQDDVAFQVDLEGALKYSFYNEISSRKLIEGDSLHALNLYIRVLAKLFPIGRHGIQFLNAIKEELSYKKELTGEQFENMALKYERQFEPVFLSRNEGEWLGCRGSTASYRGFPCSLWMMFHTLTVYADVNKDMGHPPHEVLDAMKGYVKHFFGCSHCSQHFLEMAESYPGNVTTHEDALIWLWNAHNQANRRLRHDVTSDPKHPKVQFPSVKSCPSCHNLNHTWNRERVVIFLKAMYQNISYLTYDDLDSNRHKVSSSESPQTKHKSPTKRDIVAAAFEPASDSNNRTMNFNIFDVSLCVVLYLCCLGIVIYGCMRFYIRSRANKKRYYLPEFFSKV